MNLMKIFDAMPTVVELNDFMEKFNVVLDFSVDSDAIVHIKGVDLSTDMPKEYEAEFTSRFINSTFPTQLLPQLKKFCYNIFAD